MIFSEVPYLLEDGAVMLLALGADLLNSLGGIQSSLDMLVLRSFEVDIVQHTT